MTSILKNFVTELQKKLGANLIVVELEQPVYKINIPKKDILIIFYPNNVTNRIDSCNSYRTIHIDQDILEIQFQKLLHRITVLSGLGRKIHARNTIAARIDKAVCLEFQQTHHIQDAIPGKYRYGLFENGELVSIAVFSNGRKMDSKPDNYRSFELLRFCHKLDYITVGGLSKLIKAFVKDFSPGDIMTYVDKDWSQQSSLTQIGFKEIGSLEPQTYLLSQNSRTLIKTETSPTLQFQEGTYLKKNSGSLKMKLFLEQTT